LTAPSGVTSTFDGFRSRCTISARCAASTARQGNEQAEALAQEQPLFDLRIKAAAQEFYRDVLIEIPAFARAQKHRRHAAFTEQAHEPERADALSDEAFRQTGFLGEAPGVLADRCVEKAAAGVVGGIQQTFERAAFFPIGDVGIDPGSAHSRRKIDDRIEQRAQPRHRRIAVLQGGRVVGHRLCVHGRRVRVVSVERRSVKE